MAVTTHFQGGISTPIVTTNRLSASGLAIRASSGHFGVRTSSPTSNLKFQVVKATNGPGKSYATPGVLAGDVVLSSPGYAKFSDGGMRTVGLATGWTVQTAGASMSFVGIVSGSMVAFAYYRY